MNQRWLMRRSFGLLAGFLLVAFLVVAIAPDALAQAGGRAAENFSCSGDGKSQGKLYSTNASCPTTLSFDHIFSYFICNMEQLSSNLMGNMYCGMVTNLTPMVMAVMTLAVLVFGMGFTIGVIPATAREFQKFLIKVAFILAFATQSEYLIGYGYRFLVEGAREGIAIALSGLYTAPDGAPTTGNSSANVYAQLDGFLGRTMQFATDYVGTKWNSASGSNPCQNAIFAVMAIMAIAFPPVFYLSLLIIGKIALTFIRAVFGYVYAIVGITFLLSLAPFFLSFYMFQATRQYFDKWLGYLISFSLQMVIVFAFLTFIVSIDVKNSSNSLPNIIVPVQETQETTSLRLPWQYCTLCEFEVLDREGNVVPEGGYDNFIGQGKLRCKANPNYSPTATDPSNRVNYTPIRALSAVAPQEGTAPDRNVQGTLMKFAGTALLSLLVLAYIIDSILRFIPYFAQKIAGGLASYAPQLGGGTSPSGVATLDIPGLRNEGGEYRGVFGSFERGFNAGFSRPPGQGQSGDSISRTARGMTDAFRYTFGTNRDAQGQTIDPRRNMDSDPGLVGGIARWFTNPLGTGRE